MLNNEIDKQKLLDLGGSRVKVNREYLLRTGVAKDLNTYLGWNEFKVFGDIMDGDELQKYLTEKGYDPKVGAPGAKSIFNKYGAVLTGNIQHDNTKISAFRLGNNVPLIDTPENRKKMRTHSNCTIRELVEASSTGMLGRALYSYSDFMYCKYLGVMPNNYLITLRRFPVPVDDYISTIGEDPGTRHELTSKNCLPIGNMVAWLNTPGNDIEQILTYSMKMPYEEKEAQWEEGANADASSKPLNSIFAAFDPTYREQVSAGQAGNAIFQNDYVGKIFGKAMQGTDPPYSGFLSWRDQNKIYGPIDAVKKVYYRSDKGGLDFNQEIKLTFEYEIKSYNGINGRQAMLDLISNILQVTYSTGTFWGGGYRSSGAHQSNIFTNLNVMKARGGFANFVDAFFQDAGNFVDRVSGSGGLLGSDKEFSIGNIGKAFLNFFNNLGGMITGALLNKLGRPQKAMVNSLLSPAPTGLWHVTIGNPFHPIMSIGNMVLKNTTITHSGPLGIDDFPTNIKVECTLERGKPRDIREIEMLYMNGNDRIYFPMGNATDLMYNKAKNYKSNNSTTSSGSAVAGTKAESIQVTDEWEGVKEAFDDLKQKFSTAWSKSALKRVLNNESDHLRYYFGTADKGAIKMVAREMEYGSQKKKKE